MSPPPPRRSTDAWIAKQEIRDGLARYCRGLDRMDRALAASVFSENATANYVDMYEGSAEGFLDWVWKTHAAMSAHSHQVTNLLVELDGTGKRATSEAYVTVVLWPKRTSDTAQTEIVVRGRYLDRWTLHEGRWTIEHRVHVADTHSVCEVRPGPTSPGARRDAQDASRDFLTQGAEAGYDTAAREPEASSSPFKERSPRGR